MNANRREFLKGTSWMGLAAVAAGCGALKAGRLGGCAGMQGFAAPALKKVRVGVCGLGMRGVGAVHRLSNIPGVEVVALCDLHQERIDAQVAWLKEAKKPAAKQYCGAEAWRALCASDLDVVYNTTPWDLHVPIALAAMENGKHAMVEVPSAFTLEECWALVETSERTQRHCMQLENCCYGEAEMLCFNLVRQGLMGELVHGEGAYIHDLRDLCYADWAPERDYDAGKGGYVGYWRLKHNVVHKGNQYETHGLGPVCDYMDINRSDRLATLVSIESDQFNYEAYGRTKFPGTWKDGLKVAMGDMNTTVIRTAKGRSIMVQHDVSSPRPYRRHNLLTGTRGSFEGINFFETAEEAFANGNPCHFGWGEKAGDPVHSWFDFKKTQAMREKYRHPLWKTAGELAKLVGGHGGMDFLMDLRWAFCLQNGLPLDHDVYDLASWCSLGELTERAVRRGGEPQDIPDFTRGGWKTAKPLGLVDVDLGKMGFNVNSLKKDKSALNVG